MSPYIHIVLVILIAVGFTWQYYNRVQKNRKAFLQFEEKLGEAIVEFDFCLNGDYYFN